MEKTNKPTSKCLLKRCSRYFSIDHIILIIITAVHSVNNYIWTVRDRIPPGWDTAQYLTYSYQYHNLFSNPTSSFFSQLLEINRQRPPLRLFVTSPFYGLFGLNIDVAVMTNIIYMVILIFAVYGIGKYLFSREVGLLAAVLVSFFPILHCISRSFLVDYASTAMVALSIYLLLKTEYFTNKKYSILFGISLGLGALTRDAFPVFMLGPLLYVMYKSSILQIPWLIKTLLRNYLALIMTAVSGAAVGLYINFLLSQIFWPGDPRVSGTISIIIVIAMVVLFIGVWLFWSLIFNTYSSLTLKTILLRNAVSFLPFTVVLAAYSIPRDNKFLIFALVPIALALLFVLNLILLKKAYTEWWQTRKQEIFKRNAWLNFSRSLIFGVLISAWWYIPSAYRVFPNMFLNPTYVKPEEGHVYLHSWESMSYYFIGLLNQQIYLFFFILIICIILVIYRYGRSALAVMRSVKITRWPKTLILADWKSKLTLLLWVVVPYIFFTLSHTKNSRYITPYLPAIAIFMAAALLSFPKRWQKGVAVLVVLSLGGLQMVTFSYGIDELPEQIVVDTPLGELLLFGQVPLGRHQYEIHPSTEEWNVDDVLHFIYKDYRNDTTRPSTVQVGTISDSRLNAYVFKYTVLEEDLPINIQSTAFYETEAWVNESHHTFYKNFDNLDYIVEMENFILREKHNKTLQWFHKTDNFSQFFELQRFQLPEGIVLVVYKRI